MATAVLAERPAAHRRSVGRPNEINGMDVEAAASAFDIVPEAVVEELDYASKNEALLASEAAEERRRVELALAFAHQ